MENIERAHLLHVNIRGQIFSLDYPSLDKYPTSLLGAIAKNEETFSADPEGRCYFNRNPALFNHICDFYNTGKLCFPAQYSWTTVKEELDFWRLDAEALTKECEVRYDAEKTLARRGEELAACFDRYEYMSRGTSCPQWASKCRTVWEFVDIPQSSRLAMVYNVAMCVILPLFSLINMFVAINGSTDDGKEKMFYHRTGHKVVEILILVIFTLEIILRFVVWPSKLRYFVDPLNWVDIISTLLCWVGVCVKYTAYRYIFYAMFFSTFRFFRVFRIWRAYSPCRVIVLALQYSIKEFCLTAFIFYLLELMFAFWIQAHEIFVEDEHKSFTDIVACFYWAVSTMTTVGYGDVSPLTTYGKTIAGFCAGTGMLMLVLPVAVFCRNYSIAAQHVEAAEFCMKAAIKQGKVYTAARPDVADAADKTQNDNAA